ncbi:MAG: sensor domain-containing diguanylate cyclase [Gammaproteobacteria bacterium]|nr:sensor domain-containing diguanylate cyclase [Gammaproteobacteria bacterium]
MDQTQLLKAYREAVAAMRKGNFKVTLPIDNSKAPLGLLGQELVQLGNWLEQRFEQIRKIQQISQGISRGLFAHEVLERVYDTFHQLIPYDRIGCALISEDRCSVRACWAKSNYPDSMRITQGYQAELAGSSLETILDTGAPRILNDLEAYLEAHPDSVSTQLIVAEGIRSSLTCPLIAEGKPVGFLFFSSREKDTYRPEHQRTFLEIAAYLSVLMERSHYYQQIHDLNQKLLQVQDTLREQALRDALTGALNHGAILESLDEHLGFAQRQFEPLSILMADLDQFKRINDRHGHPTGDAVLKAVAATLQACLRGHDRLGRYGGEEFLMVLGSTPLEVAQQVAERIRAEVAALQVLDGSETLRATISIGVATYEPDAMDQPDSLLARADAALYEAKRMGRNRVCLAPAV